ncbi:hypothetical protein A6768_08490 [Sphingobium yanoikuyae]|uniref:Uncharacterized protein n=1 Tax=Sphingobium yanoikuyae TaxID=13690 RepID=A0A291MY53_SPHYA|nr:hypothetical protein A6768_08490 [Sphingobium yanoikuyae]
MKGGMNTKLHILLLDCPPGGSQFYIAWCSETPFGLPAGHSSAILTLTSTVYAFSLTPLKFVVSTKEQMAAARCYSGWLKNWV